MVVMGLFALFNVIVFIPLAQEFLRIFPLPGALDYFVIGVVTLVWGIVLLGIWRSRWLWAGARPAVMNIKPKINLLNFIV